MNNRSLMNKRMAALTTALVLLAVFATAFGMINYENTVRVWPLKSSQPLTFVIGVSFLLGAGTVGLLALLLNHKRALASASPAMKTIPMTGV